MSTLQEHLDDLDPSASIRTLVSALTAGTAPGNSKKPEKAPQFCANDGHQLSPSGVCFECA